MYLENGRSLVWGILLFIFVAIAYWVNFVVGMLLMALLGLNVLQAAFTDWCPADLFLRPMGLKKKLENKK